MDTLAEDCDLTLKMLMRGWQIAYEPTAIAWVETPSRLLDLLKQAGIEAYPALVQAAPQGRIDPEFPVPGWFDHMIAALPAAGLALTADDPVAGGYLFVDPTQTRGGAGWLHPADQDHLPALAPESGQRKAEEWTR